MPNHFHVDDSAVQTTMGRDLLDVLRRLGQDIAELESIRDAMREARDAASSPAVASDHATNALLLRFLDAPGGAVSASVTLAAFVEIDYAVNTAAAAIKQLCAQIRQ
ncbi:hypothetical protein [Tautonia plasticadhaerens]|uniref:Uncharacterized protein n=1 Tax=Tautonia plasticadhaerens TaxID=2527974 RepID=A0A518GZI6_9BACT|nr:hypothetical protein [Tautonia plasticadhaerens]QDV34018.1 hypothetical protein ElP_18990 [Tautonia plasticadhaerens]